MIKLIIKIAILVAVIVVFMVSNPSTEDHKKAISDIIENATESTEEDGLAHVKEIVRNKIVSMITTDMLQVKDYGVCSVGRIETKGESRIVSFGILGHVFTPGSDRLIQSTKTGDIKEELKSKVLDF
ncbi:MAG: hypothetical protein ACI30P_06070 [Muribaculaceae bacterium]|nr:hypothetical protein [Bacteroidales bacterium]